MGFPWLCKGDLVMDGRWKYIGPDSFRVEGRNLKGANGRVVVSEVLDEKDIIVIKIDGLSIVLTKTLCEELGAAINSQLRPHSGIAVFGNLSKELDAVIGRMMAGEESPDGRDAGRAETLTRVLAMLRNPRNPDYALEKARAMERRA